MSSPAVVLAAIAERTKSIRLTSAVTVLSVLDPVWVYQDFAILDLVSHGRAEVIVGRSAFPEPFAIFGADLEDYDALFSEKLDLAPQAARARPRHLVRQVPAPLSNAPIAPRAHQHPLPVWIGVGGSPESAERAGRLGLPMVLGFIGGPISHAQRAVDVYRAAGMRAGHPEKLRLRISTHFFAGESPTEARRVFPYYHEYLRPKTPGGRGFIVDRPRFEAGTQRGQAIIGQVDWGGLPRAMVEESITRLATEIAPAVRTTVSATTKQTT